VHESTTRALIEESNTQTLQIVSARSAFPEHYSEAMQDSLDLNHGELDVSWGCLRKSSKRLPGSVLVILDGDGAGW
jgi:hypothetical protein